METVESQSIENKRKALIKGSQTLETVTHKIASLVFERKKHPLAWSISLIAALILLGALAISVLWLLYKGVGVWGINIPVGWGLAIINFEWWMAIGQSLLLLSVSLLLMRQPWRNSLSRILESMAIFAVMCAGIFPILHLGRPWVFYWLMPMGPNILGLWPQFRSPLVWDVFAMSAFMAVAILYWYMGLIPDIACLRDRTGNRTIRIITGVLAMGWRGSARHWKRYQTAYYIVAGLCVALTISAYSFVSFDFAISIIPAWHSTILPVFYVSGAIFEGTAIALTIIIPLRAWYGLQNYITEAHIDWLAKFLLGSGVMVLYGYLTEAFYTWYGGDKFEKLIVHNQMFGHYAPLFWIMLGCNILAPLFLWAPKFRRNVIVVFIVAMFINLGMWLDRFITLITSLSSGYIPSSWGIYTPSIWEIAVFVGSIGLFIFLMCLFVRFIPAMSLTELKTLLVSETRQKKPINLPDEITERVRATKNL